MTAHLLGSKTHLQGTKSYCALVRSTHKDIKTQRDENGLSSIPWRAQLLTPNPGLLKAQSWAELPGLVRGDADSLLLLPSRLHPHVCSAPFLLPQLLSPPQDLSMSPSLHLEQSPLSAHPCWLLLHCLFCESHCHRHFLGAPFPNAYRPEFFCVCPLSPYHKSNDSLQALSSS